VTKCLAQPIGIDTTIAFPDAVEVTLTSAEPTSAKMPVALGRQIYNLLQSYVLADSDDARDRAEDALRKLGVTDLNPITMSRTTGEFVMRIEGQAVWYQYAVKGGGR